MKKQMTVMDLGIVLVAVIAAVIAISASQQYARRMEAPNFPVIKSNAAVVEESSVKLAESSARGEGEGQYSTVVISPETGAEVAEWTAPQWSGVNESGNYENEIF